MIRIFLEIQISLFLSSRPVQTGVYREQFKKASPSTKSIVASCRTSEKQFKKACPFDTFRQWFYHLQEYLCEAKNPPKNSSEVSRLALTIKSHVTLSGDSPFLAAIVGQLVNEGQIQGEDDRSRSNSRK